MAMTPDDVLKLIKDREVKFVDLRFTDTRGKEQHVSVPSKVFGMSQFESGHAFDGSSIAGWKGIQASDMLLMPDAASARLDPFSDEAVINISCDVVEPATPVSLNPLPVAGRLIQRFGEPDDQAQPAKGMIYESRTGAAVVAPYDGRILFAGPFRGYGLILIIEHGEGYHSLLSGLGRIDGGVGQWVLAGEPVGAMVQATEGNPRLYLELRRQGHPINPQPWLAAGTGKVSG